MGLLRAKRHIAQVLNLLIDSEHCACWSVGPLVKSVGNIHGPLLKGKIRYLELGIARELLRSW